MLSREQLEAMIAHLAAPQPPSPPAAQFSLSTAASTAATAPRESKSESEAKARRLRRAFGQVPPEWTDLERVGDHIEIYTHEHAVVCQNDKTTVLLGLYDRNIPVAVKRTIKPRGALDLKRALCEKNVLMRLSHNHIVQARGRARGFVVWWHGLLVWRVLHACDLLLRVLPLSCAYTRSSMATPRTTTSSTSPWNPSFAPCNAESRLVSVLVRKRGHR